MGQGGPCPNGDADDGLRRNRGSLVPVAVVLCWAASIEVEKRGRQELHEMLELRVDKGPRVSGGAGASRVMPRRVLLVVGPQHEVESRKAQRQGPK